LSEQRPVSDDTRCIHQVFEEIADRNPGRVAVVCGDERWTYAKLNEEANRVAHLLASHQLTHEERVAIALPRSCGYIAAILGVLKAGGAYVPIVDNQPAPRLRSMLRDCEARFMIGQSDHLPQAHQDVAHVLTTTDAQAQPTTNLNRSCSPSDLAYVMYTSGSTGEPKGVMIEHDGVLRLVHDQWFLPVGLDVHYLCVSSYGFDASTIEIYAALLHGSKLAMTTQRVPEPGEVRDLVVSEQVQAIWIAFGFFCALFEADPTIFESVPTVLTGGEPVHAEVIRKAQQELPGVQFVNCYGPTECTALSTAYVVPPLGITAQGVLPIGKPLRGMRCEVVDQAGASVPEGAQGELVISGLGITRGYLNAPQLTRDRVQVDQLGTRSYQSGDLVQVNPEGELEFIGRIDAQVKVRGNRFELGEVESIAMAFDRIEGCVATLMGGARDPQLAIVVAASAEIKDQEICDFIADRLPSYMVPSRVFRIDDIPLTRNGKADRAAVRVLVETQLGQDSERGSTADEFQSDTERMVAGLMHDVLNVPVKHRQDRFLDLGGHSLRAVVFCARLRTKFDVQVPISSIYQSGSVAGISDLIDHLRSSDAPEQRDEIGGTDQDRTILSLNQLRLWMLDQLSPGDPSYTITIRLDHDGELDHASFQRAWFYLCQRHRVLCAHIETSGDEPNLVFDAPELAACKWSQDQPVDGAEIAQTALRESSRGFDLEQAPLVRCQVIRTTQGACVLISMHHIISDAWSCEILQRELKDAYLAYLAGSEPDHEPLTIHFGDYTRWERKLPERKSYQVDLQAWRAELLGAPLLRLPADYLSRSRSSNRGVRVELPLGHEVVEELQHVSHSLGVTPFAYMLSMFNVWLHRLTREEDIVVGVPVANRQLGETQGLIGFFMETLALRNAVTHDLPLRKVIQRVAATSLTAFDRRDVAFQHIVQSLGLHADQGKNPLFEVFFNHIAIPLASSDEGARVLAMSDEEIDNQTAKFDLTCYIFDDVTRPRVVFNARKSLFSEHTVRWYLTQFVRLLEQSMEHLDTPVSQVPLDMMPISPPDPARVPAPSLPLEIRTDGTILEHVEWSVKSNMGRIAVRTSAGSMTYAKLWERSGRVASRLHAQGIGHGHNVLIAASCPMDVCVSVLGVLRVGAAFVPTDLHWPEHRLSEIMKILNPEAVLVPDETACPKEGGTVVLLSSLDSEQEKFADTRIDPGEPAYVMFTSGSTGKPKGVIQSHRSVVGHMQTFAHSLSLSPDDKVLQLSSFAFDASVMDMFACWFSGSALCVADPRVDEPDCVLRFINEHNINTVHAAPSLFRWFIGGVKVSQVCEPVRAVVFGGEHCTDHDIDALQAVFPNCDLLINGLGLTESSLNLQYRIDPCKPINWPTRVPVGYPVEGTRVRLVDRDGNQTAPTGEIEIESDRIATSYFNQESLLGEECSGSGSRRWRTGDIATVRHDGSMMHLGREDDQVKVRGCRIELGEVTHAIRAIDGVHDVAVIAEDSQDESAHLIAYVVCDEQVTQAKLSTDLVSFLPLYMIPQVWIRLKNIPRVGGGKISSSHIRKEEHLPFAHSNQEQSSPPDQQTQIIMKGFNRILGVPAVHQHDDFFHLGGNSLKAIQLFNYLKGILDTEIPISVIYRAPTPRALSLEYQDQCLENGSTNALIQLREGEQARRVVVLPGIGGHPLGFGPLIDRVQTQVEFVGVQYPNENTLNEIGRSLHGLAGWVIDHLDLEHSDPIPSFIGYSFGGSLAVEIAMQLRQRGHTHGKLMLLDAHLPFGLPQRSRFGKARVHLARIVQGHETSRVGYIREKLKARNSLPTQEEARSATPELDSYKAISRINRKMVIDYRTELMYDGTVSLVRALQPDWLRFHHDDGYNGFSRVIHQERIIKHEVHAEHLELFDPGPAAHIAQIVDQWLDSPDP
jgi:amino acid adenylation domain-containing protein